MMPWVEFHGMIDVDHHRLQVKVYYDKVTVKIRAVFLSLDYSFLACTIAKYLFHFPLRQ